jgi:EpsI family protein
MEPGRLKRIYIVTALFIAVAGFSAWYRVPAGAAVADKGLNALPEQLGVWTKAGTFTFDKGVLELLGTRDAFGTVYKNTDGRSVRVVLVQAVNNRSAFHPPEYCLTGGGSEVIAKTVRTVPLEGASPLRVNEMVFTTAQNGRFFVWNWYASGKATTENFYRQQLALVWQMMRTRHAKGTMVNLFTEVVGDESPEDAAPAAADFTSSLMPYLNEYL